MDRQQMIGDNSGMKNLRTLEEIHLKNKKENLKIELSKEI